jgi:hypothetical protein
LHTKVPVPVIIVPTLFGPAAVTVTGAGVALMHVATP